MLDVSLWNQKGLQMAFQADMGTVSPKKSHLRIDIITAMTQMSVRIKSLKVKSLEESPGGIM